MEVGRKGKEENKGYVYSPYLSVSDLTQEVGRKGKEENKGYVYSPYLSVSDLTQTVASRFATTYNIIIKKRIDKINKILNLLQKSKLID